MDTAKSITITEPEAKAIIGRLRHLGDGHPLHNIEVSLIGRLLHEVSEFDREPRRQDIIEPSFDFGDV